MRKRPGRKIWLLVIWIADPGSFHDSEDEPPRLSQQSAFQYLITDEDAAASSQSDLNVEATTILFMKERANMAESLISSFAVGLVFRARSGYANLGRWPNEIDRCTIFESGLALTSTRGFVKPQDWVVRRAFYKAQRSSVDA